MSKSGDLARLTGLAALTLDHCLGRMRAASLALERSRDQLAAINLAAKPADLPLIAAARAELAYQCWADQRRSELNLVIARQTADWLTARDAAKTAFGRRRALQDLAAAIKPRRRDGEDAE